MLVGRLVFLIETQNIVENFEEKTIEEFIKIAEVI